MDAEDEDIRVSGGNQSALNSRLVTNPDVEGELVVDSTSPLPGHFEGELVVDSTSPLPGQIVCRSRGQAEQERSGGHIELQRSIGHVELQRSIGQAEQQPIGMHLWAPGSSTYFDDVTRVVTTALPSVPAQVVDEIRNRRFRFPLGEADPALPAPQVGARDNARAAGADGFISTGGSKELQTEEEEYRSLRDRFHCKICLELPIDAVFMPCGHRFSCLQCSQRYFEEQERQRQPRRCFICRCDATVMSVNTT